MKLGLVKPQSSGSGAWALRGTSHRPRMSATPSPSAWPQGRGRNRGPNDVARLLGTGSRAHRSRSASPCGPACPVLRTSDQRRFLPLGAEPCQEPCGAQPQGRQALGRERCIARGTTPRRLVRRTARLRGQRASVPDWPVSRRYAPESRFPGRTPSRRSGRLPIPGETTLRRTRPRGAPGSGAQGGNAGRAASPCSERCRNSAEARPWRSWGVKARGAVPAKGNSREEVLAIRSAIPGRLSPEHRRLQRLARHQSPSRNLTGLAPPH